MKNLPNSGGIGGNLATHLAALAVQTIKANTNTFDTIFINSRSGIPRKKSFDKSLIFLYNIKFTPHERPNNI